MTNKEAPYHLTDSIIISPQQPGLQFPVRNQLMDFLVDTGATHSILNTKLIQNSQKAVSVVGDLRSSTTKTFPTMNGWNASLVIFL